MSNIGISVVVDDDHLGETDAITRQLERAGLSVESVVAEAGAIFGSGDESILEALRQVRGVTAARPEGIVRLPPLSDKVPQ